MYNGGISMTSKMKKISRSLVFLIVIAVMSIIFVPVASAGIVRQGNSDNDLSITTASTNYQYIPIDTGFPKLTPVNYSQLDYIPLVPRMYTSVIQKGSTSQGNFITIDTGIAPIIPISYIKPQSPMQIPDTNPGIFYPECQSAGGLINSFGKGFFSTI
jgi:hypothetical protein